MYKQIQIEVFEWLKSKYDQDNSFTFSVRQKASKGAELNYFIGTEKSKYFATTFWFVPVSYPGSSGDLLSLVFDLRKKSGIEFFFQLNQTRDPQDSQNSYALELIKNIKDKIGDRFEHVYAGSENNKMEFFGVYSTPKYSSFQDLLPDLEVMISEIIPIVDEEIKSLKNIHPDFVAHRFTSNEQENMLQKMQDRFKRYKIVEDLENELEEDEEFDGTAEPEDFRPPLNQILYGPPGTGKTYTTISKAVRIANPDFNINQPRKGVKEEYQRLVKAGQIMFTTFHQSMSYEDFVEGIKPETKEGRVIYDVKDGLFKLISDKAKDNWISNQFKKGKLSFEASFERLKDEWEEDNSMKFSMKRDGNEFTIMGFSSKSISFKKASGGTGHTLSINTLRELFYGEREITSKGVGIYYPPILDKLQMYSNKGQEVEFFKNFVLIIDEINRGNVSQIFGELITLIEPDKRLGEDERIELNLPYSKDEKFGVPPNLYIIGTMNTADKSVEALDSALRRRFVFEEILPDYDLKELDYTLYDFQVSDILKTINSRIEKLLDRDHSIGHAYFIGKDATTIIDSFYRNIIPLLQEYFFCDYGKIGLILGSGFVQKLEKESVFADFDYSDSSQYDQKEIFEIINHKDDPAGFKFALQTLMKK